MKTPRVFTYAGRGLLRKRAKIVGPAVALGTRVQPSTHLQLIRLFIIFFYQRIYPLKTWQKKVESNDCDEIVLKKQIRLY